MTDIVERAEAAPIGGAEDRRSNGAVRLLLRRLRAVFPTVLAVSFAVFALVSFGPGDPATTIAGEQASPEMIAEVRTQLGLDRPLLSRYGDWLGDAVRGDLGTSILSRQSVSDVVVDGLPKSLSIAVLGMAGAAGVALAWGIAAARRPGRVADWSLSVGSSVLLAMPSFFIALVLVSELAIKRRVLPAVGYSPVSERGVITWFEHLIIPSLAVGAVVVGELARQVRGSVRTALQRDYTLIAYAKGLSEAQVVLKHALRNALIPVVTVLGTRFASVVGGTVLVERVCGIQGLGWHLVGAVRSGDLPVVTGISIVLTLVVLGANLLCDLAYLAINPRLRHGG